MREMTTENTVYVTYIATTPEKLWTALTSSAFTTQFFFGASVESDWKVGSPWQLRMPNGQVQVKGEVRESTPPRRLMVSWLVNAGGDFHKFPECFVSYEIEPMGNDVVRLTMIEAHPTPIAADLLKGGRDGWPRILSGLKSLLETGKPLNIPVPQPPKEM